MTCIWRGSVWSAEEPEEPDVFKIFIFVFFDLVLFCIFHSFHQIIFLYISWSFCKIIVSFFFLFSLPCLLFPTQTLQKPTFSSSWWASFGGGRGGRLTMLSGTLLVLGVMMMMMAGTMMKKTSIVVTMKMLSVVTIRRGVRSYVQCGCNVLAKFCRLVGCSKSLHW